MADHRHRPAVHDGIEGAGHAQDAVAQHFRFEAPQPLSPEQPVVGVAFAGGSVKFRIDC